MGSLPSLLMNSQTPGNLKNRVLRLEMVVQAENSDIDSLSRLVLRFVSDEKEKVLCWVFFGSSHFASLKTTYGRIWQKSPSEKKEQV